MDPDGELATAGPPAGVQGIDHVGVATLDLDATVRWYAEVLGLREIHREVNETQQVVEVMLAGATDDGAQVQVLAPTGPSSPIAAFLDRRGAGVQHVAYRVHDIAAVSAQLRSTGVDLLYDSPRLGTRGSQINFVHPRDAGGVLTELVQPAVGVAHSGADRPGGSEERRGPPDQRT